MSLTRTRLTSIRSREEAADARRTRNVIALICALAAFGYVGWILLLSNLD